MRRFHWRMTAWVCILASKPRGTLYVGAANDLARRVHEHREGPVDGFAKQHGVTRLVYYEPHATMPLAIQRERNIEHWSRAWKPRPIEGMNPQWRELWDDISR